MQLNSGHCRGTTGKTGFLHFLNILYTINYLRIAHFKTNHCPIQLDKPKLRNLRLHTRRSGSIVGCCNHLRDLSSKQFGGSLEGNYCNTSAPSDSNTTAQLFNETSITASKNWAACLVHCDNDLPQFIFRDAEEPIQVVIYRGVIANVELSLSIGLRYIIGVVPLWTASGGWRGGWIIVLTGNRTAMT
jgi:hypothetical protein